MGHLTFMSFSSNYSDEYIDLRIENLQIFDKYFILEISSFFLCDSMELLTIFSIIVYGRNGFFFIALTRSMDLFPNESGSFGYIAPCELLHIISVYIYFIKCLGLRITN